MTAEYDTGVSAETNPEPGVAGSTADPGADDGFGDPRVDAAVARLDQADGRTATEQVAEYEAVHRVLQDTLATIDEA